MKSRIRLCAALALAVAACSTPTGEATTIELRPYVGRLRTIDVEVAGHAGRMLFDTGAGVTSLTPAFAARVGCTPRGVTTAFRMNGERVTFQRCPALRMRIGETAMLQELGVFDLGAVLPADLPHVDGIVGLDVFRDGAVTILEGLSGLRIETPRSLALATAGLSPGRLRLAQEAGGAGLSVFVPAASPEGELWLLLDSANLSGVRLHPWSHAALAGSPAVGPVQLTVEGAAPVSITPQVDASLIYDGALDASFLAAHPVTLDLASEQAWWSRAN